MDEPLGWKVGNALEIQESIDALKGVEVPVVTELSVEFAALMVALAKDCPIESARAECRARLADGSAYRCFAEMVRLQGGDLEAFVRLKDDPELVVQTVTAARGGFVAEINARAVAEAALGLGAGRTQLTDEIDPLAGVELLVRRGMAIQPGQPVARLYAKKKATGLPMAAETVVSAISQTEPPPAEKPPILARF
jgi:thymidine phosphorylase